MPGLYKDEGVVLRTIKLGEADRIVTLFMRENGKVRAVAKGIRKTKSRFGGRLEPFTRADLMLYRGRKDLDTITAVDVIEPFRGLRADYERVMAANALAEMVEKITPDRERAFPTYALLVGGLDALAGGRGDSVVPAFLIKLLSICGFHPQLRTCAGCGDGADLGGFSPALGGVVCGSCWDEAPDAHRMSGERIALLAELLRAEFGCDAGAGELAEARTTLQRYAEYHLERPLRSLQLLASI